MASELRSEENQNEGPFGLEQQMRQEEGSNYDSDYESEVSSDEPLEEKKTSHRPGDNAFRQQRLRAFNPVMTAKTVIPILMAIAIIFVPLGAAMWYAAHRIQDVTIDYTQCEKMASKLYWSEIPTEYVTYNYRTKDHLIKQKAQWKLETDESQQFEDERNVCKIQFPVANKLSSPIYFFYRLNKFYANHRRFVKSFSEEQIIGNAASENTIKNTPGQNCEPLSVNSEGKKYYPCGLIANSLFNDTFTTTLQGVNGTSHDYKLTENGIAWKADKNRFKKTKYHYSDITPPPNWYKRFPDGYNESNVPDISTWYQFQNWMHPSGLPRFNKLALRNDHDDLEEGVYEITIGLHFPVLPFNGNKYVYISQRSVIGGKNFFLGISWIVGGGICFLLGLLLLIVNTIKSRKTGDINLLSWNREEFAKDEAMDVQGSPEK
ncbi:uncharacterized protein PRCAT00000229001 [Priceomyces carsonii]|uniref:uncharacterized protein n=1 Tax=Priceomyces carsonii TaxID=28549 RepID=UPI002EDB26E8|nr:unnamed protein product [Priceomyces carsonii]